MATQAQSFPAVPQSLPSVPLSFPTVPQTFPTVTQSFPAVRQDFSMAQPGTSTQSFSAVPQSLPSVGHSFPTDLQLFLNSFNSSLTPLYTHSPISHLMPVYMKALLNSHNPEQNSARGSVDSSTSGTNQTSTTTTPTPARTLNAGSPTEASTATDYGSSPGGVQPNATVIRSPSPLIDCERLSDDEQEEAEQEQVAEKKVCSLQIKKFQDLGVCAYH